MKLSALGSGGIWKTLAGLVPSALVAAGLFSFVFPLAAQMDLTWSPGGGVNQICRFTWNSSGVSLASNGELRVTGTFAGKDCPTSVVSNPVFTNGIDASDLPATAATGSSHTITWAATADSCTYANSSFPASVTNWPTSGSACASAAACSAQHSVGITFPSTPGTYRFELTCSKVGAASTAVASRTVQVSTTPPPGCIAPAGLTRQTVGTVAYNNTVSRNEDLTRFENVFGHDNSGGPYRLFPGTANLNQRIYIVKNRYVALQFTVPANFPAGTYGQFRFEETQPQTNPARMSYTISKSCGDFSATATAPLTARCIVNNGPPNSTLLWAYDPAATQACLLERGQTYYLNIVHASLASPTSSYCVGSTGTECGNTMQNAKLQGSGWPTEAPSLPSSAAPTE